MALTVLQLVIGDKRFSSWSLRPWLLLKQAGIAFDEVNIWLRQPDTKQNILKYSPSGRIPALVTQEGVIWDSLAIGEYVAETFPDKKLWPGDRFARAVARSVSAEIHSGFPNLRNEMSMDCLTEVHLDPVSDATRAEIERIKSIWEDCRSRFGGGGDFLFGHFTVADAMYAPVVSRFKTYGVKPRGLCQDYCATILALAPFQAWVRGAEAEVAQDQAAQG